MLFNSFPFLLFFLPAVLIVYLTIARVASPSWRIPFLLGASLFFYGWWNPENLWLIAFSILFNFVLCTKIDRLTTSPSHNKSLSKTLLAIGAATNLAMLAFYKYSRFLLTLCHVDTKEMSFLPQELPLAISFFIFQQIAFLVDTYRRTGVRADFTEYAAGVTFFPHLIAGPLINYGSLISQLRGIKDRIPVSKDLAIGFMILTMGLAKKILIADQIQAGTDAVFALASSRDPSLTAGSAWIGCLGYTFQLYFDFSGYSDMAIGLARMFGIIFPVNFISPYKATSIIDFWRRWHVTLSAFLRDYLYIPLGGNRRGPWRRHLNLMITMLLGGIWHGAGLQFVVWGGLHGTYLLINHLYRERFRGRLSIPETRAEYLVCRALTFLAVAFAWVYFRASSIGEAQFFISRMLSATWKDGFIYQLNVRFWVVLVVAAITAFVFPSTQEIVGGRDDQLQEAPTPFFPRLLPFLRMDSLWVGVIFGLTFLWTLPLMERAAKFIYFQF